MEIGTPQIANSRRSVVGDGTDEQIAELVDAARPEDPTPTDTDDTPAVAR